MSIDVSASIGTVSPSHTGYVSSHLFYKTTYTARAAGHETVRAVLNGGLATAAVSFEVEDKCDYDVFLTQQIHFTAQVGDYTFESQTTVTGMGTLKRVGGEGGFLQGDGTWNLDEEVLSAPPDCVTWFIPPLTTSGPLQLDGKVYDEDNTLRVFLTFQPQQGAAVYHGVSRCTDKDGNKVEGWSYGAGGNPSLAGKVQADLSADGGSAEGDMSGAGLDMVRAQGGMFDYSATVTVIRR